MECKAVALLLFLGFAFLAGVLILLGLHKNFARVAPLLIPAVAGGGLASAFTVLIIAKNDGE